MAAILYRPQCVNIIWGSVLTGRCTLWFSPIHHGGDDIVGEFLKFFPDSKVHGANMGPIWGRQDPGNFSIWDGFRLAKY